jgi:hypothetical protein
VAASRDWIAEGDEESPERLFEVAMTIKNQ